MLRRSGRAGQAASEPAGEGDGDDAHSAAPPQGPGAGGERRPGRQHVVDEEDAARRLLGAADPPAGRRPARYAACPTWRPRPASRQRSEQRQPRPLRQTRRRSPRRGRSRGPANAAASVGHRHDRAAEQLRRARATRSAPPSGRRPEAGVGTSARRRGRGRRPHGAPRTRRGRSPTGPARGAARGQPVRRSAAQCRRPPGASSRARRPRRAAAPASRRQPGWHPCRRSSAPTRRGWRAECQSTRQISRMRAAMPPTSIAARRDLGAFEQDRVPDAGAARRYGSRRRR